MQTSRNAPCPCGATKPNGEPVKYKSCCLAKDEEQRKPHTGEDALLILQPTRGAICYETQVALDLNIGTRNYRTIRIARKPVAEARNLLAKYALEAIEKGDLFDFTPRETFILWVDDDAWLPPGLVPQMMQAMNDPRLARLDALFAWFCTRAPYSAPIAYRRLDNPDSRPRLGVDCKHGDLVPIQAAGFHCVLMRPRLLLRIGVDPFTPLERTEGEDFAFCRRANAIGARLAVGTGLPVAHVDPRDGMAYMVGTPPLMVHNNELRLIDAVQHRALDGGTKAGEVRSYGLGDAEATAATAAALESEELRKEVERRRIVANAAG